ncbi:MAG: pyridoxamine 5'-phosphate oxidase [Alphaproteobacteria bacterium]|nr:pyridoxamine 5'-phosphate oxidase [Alphaproteobacteria bacterium]MDA9649501.1 pyridoxamine 5'-phosphate oxidase [Alphaproteobacteria bacterium]MDB2700254.1 pyridoxamine 5'-phosphate oxidase [Alphaproteobacteria bacterium]MDC0548183.1 pyridoxamine 5'-phosphate oxidase [Alphaproteobacteria bacterium]MDC3273192.1 pyridoxamine 5'-phosphate oxidase [Alphaproteobacteria bacterium]
MELDKIVDPILLFKNWLSEAEKNEIRDPNAMQLATVSKNGMPSVRTVLLKDIIDTSFVFYTNYESRKSNEINETAKGAICFYWKSLNRQVRLTGSINKVSDQVSDKYYQSRSRGSRIGAWASKQSRELESREVLMEKVKLLESKYDEDIPRPTFWGGFALKPDEFEFWEDGDFRLHDRFVLKPTALKNEWTAKRYYP